ncbi:MAG: glycosyltransferase [Chloroflexi bacterium]|nr:glycosyltransferase [Chloroflexota bacterium]
MTELPKISLVTPSYNQAQFLETTLRSVLDQHYPKLEYFVMDGGSADDSPEIIRRYAHQFAGWVSAPDAGQAAAINAGFARSTGEIMAWLNSDDLLMPGALSLVGQIFARYPQITWLSGWDANVDVDGHITAVRLPVGRFSALIRRGWYHGRGLGFIRQESTFWRRALWERSGGQLDEKRRYTMDFALWQRFAAHADLVTVDSLLAAFRHQPQQKTAEIERYYAEIGVRLPSAARLLTLPLRAALAGPTWPLTPHVRYDRHTHAWQFRPGPLFRPGIR